MQGRTAAPARTKRWWLLAAFTLLVAATQVLWISYAAVTGPAARAFGVSEGAVGDLAGLEPLVYVLLAVPTGRWLDRRFGPALATGALLTAGGALVRAAAPTTYMVVLAGQLAVAVGQPLVLNATTKVAVRWFPAAERPTAIAVASAGQFVGILVAATTGSLLLGAGGLALLAGVHAAVAVAGAIAVLAALRVPPAFAPDEAESDPGALRGVWRDPLLRRLAVLLFVGVGLFNAVATWLDPVLADLGYPGTGGNLVALMTVTGIAGAALLPGLAARRDRRHTMLVVVTGYTVFAFLLLAVVHPLWLVTAVLAVEGFLLLAALPVALDWSELESGPRRAATATAFLLLAGNLGGVVLVVVVQLLLDSPSLALAALGLAAVPGVLVAARLPRRAPAVSR
jgi:predicted MFS family arabinose efflux permease